MRQLTAIIPSNTASRHLISQLIASTCVRKIQAVTKIITAWARQVNMNARDTTKDVRFEVFLDGDIETTSILDVGSGKWFRVSSIDGGGRPVKYEPDMFKKFDEAVNDANQNDHDKTLLFIATDGTRLYKAFTGPATAVNGETSSNDYFCSDGFDDETFIGVWSHEYMRRKIAELEASGDPEDAWGLLMQEMMTTIADYAINK